MHHSTPRASKAVRDSWVAYDKLIERAFAPRESLADSTPTPSPTLQGRDFDMDLADIPEIPPEATDEKETEALGAVWEQVRERKAKALATMPGKVESLEAVLPIERAPTIFRPPPRLRRKNSADFGLSPDGKLIVATFDMSDIGKQDMHVSFKGNKIIVAWRRVKITEKLEDDALVRERKEKHYSQIIPLPEGTSFSEVRAVRTGPSLIVSYPNLRCVRVSEPTDTSSTIFSTGETEFGTCVSPTGTLFESMENLWNKRS
ncbi:Hsp20/alpha crystallin family protein [Phanerochaete sordida]|uniref:Hsp20/alpha crystallin family protein n=1 Tax=Phanerochaete sordida TaxID=48140 RepID=A0A9P3G5W7_9APHY|nr:Hsp20/alpha crystallin family protein [Phanerochaete sordida]